MGEEKETGTQRVGKSGEGADIDRGGYAIGNRGGGGGGESKAGKGGMCGFR